MRPFVARGGSLPKLPEVFHSPNDWICEVEPARRLVAELRRARRADAESAAKVHFWCRDEVLACSGHCTDRPAYAGSDALFRWLLGLRRPDRGTGARREAGRVGSA
ncbi:unnamed protein product [Prorocentrum cordatum]|uniref:Uncharacterized protein n=1 Tax=Prorocentrum cordatum TaxID=2364126 RepID=A0ABN9U7U0_9DINO|nr:unnamed protein product [Polarella glacialis]